MDSLEKENVSLTNIPKQTPIFCVVCVKKINVEHVSIYENLNNV